jgi:DNA mismatch endonuclease (patch repair protein)
MEAASLGEYRAEVSRLRRNLVGVKPRRGSATSVSQRREGAPAPSSDSARRTMRANRAVSKREISFRKALWAAGAKGFRVKSKLPGRPDIVFPARKTAIFVNGCFWHLCSVCDLPRPSANAAFWRSKLEANRARDSRVRVELEALGWCVHVIWEHEIRPDPLPRALELARQLSDGKC